MDLNIYQISKILSAQHVNALGLFEDAKTSNKSNYYRLFSAIINEEIVNDDEAISYFGHSNNRASFNKFKQRYTEKLLDYLLLVKPIEVNFNEHYDIYNDLLRLHAAARILHLANHKNQAIILYEHIIKQAEKYEFNDILILVIPQVKSHYAFIEPNTKMYQQLEKKLSLVQKKYNDEVAVNTVYDLISHEYLFASSSNEGKKATSILDQVTSLKSALYDKGSFMMKNKILELEIFALNLNNKYQQAITTAHEVLELQKNSPIQLTLYYYNAYNELLFTYLKMGNLEKAQQYSTEILNLFTRKSHNFFNFKGVEFMIHILSKDYDKAYLSAVNVVDAKELQYNKKIVEHWAVREAFINILVLTNKIDSSLLERVPIRKFRINKFFNQVSQSSKDKRGLNISILVIKLMHHLINKEYSKIIESLDALHQYSFRYLRNDETLRSNCFIKMLSKLPEAEYNPLRTKRYVAKYQEKLAHNPLTISLKNIDTEIIPYEQLWEIIEDVLENAHKKN